MTTRPDSNPAPPAEVVENTLQEHIEWLRMTPCTSREIADHLFPTANRGSKPEPGLILTITALMWDNGFTPSSKGKGYSRWYWQEKAAPSGWEEPLTSAGGSQPVWAQGAIGNVQVHQTVPSIQKLKTSKTRYRLGVPISIREQRKAWVTSGGTIESRLDMASFYLEEFDHQAAAWYDSPVMTMAKAVCNLRYYYELDAEQTAVLMSDHFNPKARFRWSTEAIRLTWELTEGFTPSLGLIHKDAIAKHRRAELEKDVIDLLARTSPGRRVSVDALFAQFKAVYPDVDAEKEYFGSVVTGITGVPSKSSKGTRYYSGFHFRADSIEPESGNQIPWLEPMIKQAKGAGESLDDAS